MSVERAKFPEKTTRGERAIDSKEPVIEKRAEKEEEPISNERANDDETPICYRASQKN